MNKILVFSFGVCVFLAGCFLAVRLLASSPTVPLTQATSRAVSPSIATTTTPKKFSMQDVRTHKDATSCWTAINGKVYDLTTFISQHPGGPIQILSICGVDGSSAFNQQHGGQNRPANELASLYIGDLTSN